MLPRVETQSRVASIDGLRGFLALGVVFSHGLTYRAYYATHRWEWPAEYFFHFSGSVAVEVFFAITGFLFWSRALKLKGEFDIKDLYVRRFFRLYPLYAAVALMAFLVCFLAPRRLQDPSFASAAKSLALLAVPGSAPWREVNGVPIGLMLTQTWTLKIEILFYLALPFLAAAMLAKRKRAWVGRAVVLLAVAAFVVRPSLAQEIGQFELWILMPFLSGFVAAYLSRFPACVEWAKKPVASLLVLASFTGILLLRERLPSLEFVLLTVGFVPIALGNTLFGSLSRRVCRTLGDLTYSIYLLHLIVLYSIFAGVNHWVPIPRLSDVIFWCMMTTATMLTVAASLLTYKALEEPFFRPRQRTVKVESV